jgi:hypothetical protein
LAIKERLTVFFNLLETLGCFILRKGTIEDYYFSNADLSTLNKPSVAADEVAEFRVRSLGEVEARYGDVLRCLRAAAATEEINEAEVLQDVLLAVAAPALARVRTPGFAGDLNELARSTVGNLSDLFDLQSVKGNLVISLRSRVLAVGGFPIQIAADDDILKKVSAALGVPRPRPEA